MTITGLALFTTVFVLHLHHKSHKKPVPSCFSRLLLLDTNPFHKDEHRLEMTEKGKWNILLAKCHDIES